MANALMIIAMLTFFSILAICQMKSANTETRTKNALDIEKEHTEQKRLEYETVKIKAGVTDTTIA